MQFSKLVALEEEGGGDKDACYWEMKRGLHWAVSWKKLLASAQVYPEFENDAIELIERRLGYIPVYSVLMPFIPYLHTLFAKYREGKLTDHQFQEQGEEHIKDLRNADIRHCAWDRESPSEFEQEQYENYLPQYKRHAEIRMVQLLGYKPRPEVGRLMEIKLRELWDVGDTFNLDRSHTPYDFMVKNVVAYREILLNQSQVAADLSPLVSFAPFFINDHQTLFRK